MSPRRFLAGLGRTLITAGVLLLLFVAYQLWGTGIAEARDQRKGLKTFEAQLAELGLTPIGADGSGGGPSVPGTGGFDPDPSTVALPDPVTTSIPTSDSTGVASPASVVAATLPPPSTTTPSVTSSTLPNVRPGRSQMEKPKPGKTLGLLVMPRIHVRKVVVEGSDKESLKTGPGHYPTTPFPGQPGNAAIACHRTTYGAPCFNLDLLRTGDPIFVQTPQGSFRYEVERSWKVSPKDTTVLAPTPDQNVLTLTTCDPKYSAAKRLIVRARLVGPAAASDFFVEAEPEPTTVPATTVAPTLTTAAPVPTTVAGAAPTAPSEEPTTLAPAVVPTTVLALSTDTTDAASLDDQVDPGSSGPMWSLGWFRGHRSTWTSTAEWAVACAAIWVGAWLLARQRRLIARAIVYALGFAILFLPALYFCFENLARLLPENL